MKLPQNIRDLFKIEENPVISLDEKEIPKICAKERSKVVLDTASLSRVTVHYRKNRKVVEAQQ